MSETSEHGFKFRRLWQLPVLYQDWGDVQSERKVTWSELFTDLLYVVASIELSYLIINNPSAKGVALFLLYFSLFFTTWMSATMFVTRVRLEGLLYDLLSLGHTLGLLGMVLHSNSLDQYRRFAGSYCVCQAILALQYAVAGSTIPRARWNGAINSLAASTACGLSFITIFFSSTVFIGLMVAVTGMNGVLPWLPVIIPAARLPIHVEHTAERFGLIMMIYLGESIVKLGMYEVSSSGSLQYAGIACGCILIWSMHLLYYHIHPPQHHHALRLNRYRGFLWTYCHWLLGALLIMMGAGLSLTLKSYPASSGVHRHSRQLLTGIPPANRLLNVDSMAAVSLGTSQLHDLFMKLPSNWQDTLLNAHAGLHADVTGTQRGLLAATGYNHDKITAGIWIMCFAYSASIHVMAVVRAAHYLQFAGPLYESAVKHGILRVQVAWWLLVFIWPFLTYFIPFAYGRLGATGILGYIALHCLLLNLLETCITHIVGDHPAWMEADERASVQTGNHHGPTSTVISSRTIANLRTVVAQEPNSAALASLGPV